MENSPEGVSILSITMVKGVILAGGTGSRLHPCTKVTNKHLLPVWNKPMIYYPLETLLKAGINDILIVSGVEHSGDFLKLLGSGKDFNTRIRYEIQDQSGGIAQALLLAEGFIGKEKFVVILGDNIFEDDISGDVQNFMSGDQRAKIFLKEVSDPQRFGVAEVQGENIIGIEEKPKQPKSSYAVTGLYMYDRSVFDVIKQLKPSSRGELEITDVNNHYIQKAGMAFSVLKGFWTDAGTFESLYAANTLLREKHQKGN